MTRWLRRFVWLALGGTASGLAGAIWFYVVVSLESPRPPFVQVALFVMPFWYLWAAYTPAVLWMAKRHPLWPGRLLPSALRHIPFGLFLAFLHSALRYGLQPQLRSALEGTAEWDFPLQGFLGFAAYEAPVHLLLYGAILAVFHLVESTRRLRDRELAAARLGAQLAQAEVQALRMQLNPHFLFNALNGIAMLVREGEQQRAVRMLVGLSDLLRHVLDESGHQELPLRKEMEFVARYLEIEQIRFSDRLSVTLDTDPDAAEALVPSLLLQPLVENAIRHGIARRAGAAAIAITARKASGSLELRVVDDGPGFGGTGGSAAGEGTGIKNTRSRLTQMYGPDQSLKLEDVPPRGAAVTVTIPFRTVAPENGED